MNTVLKSKLATSLQGNTRAGGPSFTSQNSSGMYKQWRCCVWLNTSLTLQIADYRAFTYYSDVIKYPQLDFKQIKWNSIVVVLFLSECVAFPPIAYVKFDPTVCIWKSCCYQCPITELGISSIFPFCLLLSKTLYFLSATNKFCQLLCKLQTA